MPDTGSCAKKLRRRKPTRPSVARSGDIISRRNCAHEANGAQRSGVAIQPGPLLELFLLMPGFIPDQHAGGEIPFHPAIVEIGPVGDLLLGKFNELSLLDAADYAWRVIDPAAKAISFRFERRDPEILRSAALAHRNLDGEVLHRRLRVTREREKILQCRARLAHRGGDAGVLVRDWKNLVALRTVENGLRAGGECAGDRD